MMVKIGILIQFLCERFEEKIDELELAGVDAGIAEFVVISSATVVATIAAVALFIGIGFLLSLL